MILYPQPQNELLVKDTKSFRNCYVVIREFGVLGMVLVIFSATVMEYSLKDLTIGYLLMSNYHLRPDLFHIFAIYFKEVLRVFELCHSHSFQVFISNFLSGWPFSGAGCQGTPKT